MDFDITIYTREGCSECVKAKSFLSSKKIPYKEIIIGKDVTREDVINQFPTATILPVITTYDRAILTGYKGLEEFINDKI